jgi:lipoate-protein ligase A
MVGQKGGAMEKDTRRFRLIYEPEAGPERYMAHDFTVVDLMNEGKLPPTVLVKGWKRPVITIGHYSDIDDDIEVDRCMEFGWAIDRRKSGGGVGFYDSATMLCKFFCSAQFFPNLEKAFFDFIGEVIVETYRKLGVGNPVYKHIGDVLVGDLQGKKLSGSSGLISNKTLYIGAFLNLARPDIEKLEQVLKTPEEKFRDKVLKSAAERSTSIEEQTGKPVSKDQVKKAYVSALEEVLGVEIYQGTTTKEEEEMIKKQWEMISSDAWLYRRSSKKRFADISSTYRFARKRHKAAKLISACVLTDDKNIINDIMVYGDFYARPIDFVDELEQRLIGVSASDKEKIAAIVEELFARPDFECAGITAEEFSNPILEACREITQ